MRQIANLPDLLSGLRDQASTGDLVSVRIAPLVQGFEGNLDDLNFLVGQRQEITSRQADLLAQFTGAVRAAQRPLSPGGLLLDSACANGCAPTARAAR